MIKLEQNNKIQSVPKQMQCFDCELIEINIGVFFGTPSINRYLIVPRGNG